LHGAGQINAQRRLIPFSFAGPNFTLVNMLKSNFESQPGKSLGFRRLIITLAFLTSGTLILGQAPANDICQNATPLTINGGWFVTNNLNTVTNGPNLPCGGTTMVRDVWFSFMYPGGTVSITTQLGSLLDTRIGVRSTCTGTAIACNDDYAGMGLASRIDLDCNQLTIGQTYLIQAGGYNAQTGTFSIQITASGVGGCANPLANNFNPCAGEDNGSCTFDPLQAAFNYSTQSGCGTFALQFNSQSTGNIVNYSWSFSGGTPASSNSINPLVTFPGQGVYEVSLTVTDVFNATSTVSQNIAIADQMQLNIVIVQDNYPNETSWKLFDSAGIQVAAGNVSGGAVCIDGAECYSFVIYDSFGDGLCCGYGIGSYSLFLDGILIGSGGQFGFSEATSVNCPPGSDCNNTIAVDLGQHAAPFAESWFSFVPENSGQYLVSTCGYGSCNTTIWMYDYCNMANFDDSNAATLTYNDDFCGQQSQVTPVLQAGLTYYIRIKWDEDPLTPCEKDFFLDFLGAIAGCMNTFACNYDPIAEIPGPCYFNDDPECEDFGPDLSVRQDVFFNSMYLTTINASDACLVNEGCVQGFGARQVVRFTTWIDNIGNQDYYIGSPSQGTGQFEWDPCHNHYHYEGYAEYVAYDENGNEMPQIGFKNGFCVLDLTCPNGGIAKFTCGNMGITAGCSDYYSASLQCQWIDITDLPAGTYTLVMRVNWDQAPDANNRYELRYDNNWAAVCISFGRDANNNIINFSKSLDCVIPIDCIGQPYGSTIPDCAGNCPAQVVKGDLNNSFELEHADVWQYLYDIIGNDSEVSPCTDINADGAITVLDAALVADCINYGPDDITEFGIHNHCIFDVNIVNPNHTVTLSIGSTNTVEGYFDIYILNPDCKVVGYEFMISGATISTVQNLVNPSVYNITPLAPLGGNHVIGLSIIDEQIPKNYTPSPLVRIYYLNLNEALVCISNIVDIVNEDYHGVMTQTGPCVPAAGFDFADFTSDITTVCQGSAVQFTDLSTNATNSWAWNFTGGSPALSVQQHPIITYNVPGNYSVSLTASNGFDTDAKTIVGYINVLPSSIYCEDADGDGFGKSGVTNFTCYALSGWVLVDGDCDDSNANVYPGAPGTGQGIDNNCNGSIDNGEEIYTSACPGDFNNDGTVNFGDLTIMLSEFGCLTTCLSDMNGDGLVNFSDLNILLSMFGTNC
jgi:PKD repeat protein